ncbi:MAG: BamA/TamA family outer membrane protein [Candidatus Sumerlaeia bacterium]|nr:BamA/TamA family outer membrane protein [Candidatus Sumerlaeia bacterium]
MRRRLQTTVRQAVWLLLWLAAGAVAGALQPFPPDGTPVVSVVIEGAEKTDPERIRRVMEIKPGVAFSQAAVRRDQQAIADLGQYNPLAIRFSTSPADDGIRLLVQVRENETIDRIVFVGNVAFTATRLLRELDYKEGDILPVAARERTARSLRGFYSQGGYKNASVRVSVDPAETPGTVLVTIAIDEGEKIRIRSLLIEGNRHFPKWRIRSWVMNSGSWLLFDNYYDDRAFEDDLRVVAERHRSAGFLDATARRGAFVYNEEKAWVSPAIVITEGPRYRVRDVRLSGNTLFSDAEVRAPFDPLIGGHYDGFRVAEATQKLARLYGDQGYVNARFDGDYEKDPTRGEVVLVLAIVENAPLYVGRVDVKVQNYDYQFDLNPLERFVDWTSPGVKHETIQREVAFQPGTKYRTADEVRTVDRIRRLGFVDNVRVERVPTADPNVVDVVVGVEEDPAAGFMGATVGVGELSGPAVGVQYVNPNLFGEGKALRLGATIGSRVRSFSAAYYDRHFMGTDTSFEQELFRSYARFPGYAQRIYGSATEFGRPLDDSEDLRGYLRLRLEHVRLERHRDKLREDMDSYGVVAVRALVVRDMRNSRRWPTEGYLISGGIEPGYARNPLLKLTHSLEWYHALSRDEDWVYSYGHNFGLQPYRARRVGISERFFVGGTSTLRGFQPRGIGPRDRGERRVHVGGSTMLTQRHELRHRFSRAVQGRLFVDAGMLDDRPLHFGSPRVGTGAGVTFDLGAFSLDLDLAAAVVRQSRDRTRVFHFRLRSNF